MVLIHPCVYINKNNNLRLPYYLGANATNIATTTAFDPKTKGRLKMPLCHMIKQNYSWTQSKHSRILLQA